jgi:hypothetical protein
MTKLERRMNLAQFAAATVAQTCSLLYRGFATRQSHDFLRTADYKSAIRQAANLRYSPPIRHSFVIMV